MGEPIEIDGVLYDADDIVSNVSKAAETVEIDGERYDVDDAIAENCDPIRTISFVVNGGTSDFTTTLPLHGPYEVDDAPSRAASRRYVGTVYFNKDDRLRGSEYNVAEDPENFDSYVHFSDIRVE